MTDPFDETARDAIDARFARRCAIIDNWPADEPRLTIAELTARLLGGEFQMRPEQWLAVRRSPAVLSSWNHLLSRLTVAEVPRVAAASSRSERPLRVFDGGSITTIASAVPGSTYVRIGWRPVLAPPRSLLLQSDDMPPLMRPLPGLRPSGDWLFVCNSSREADRRFLALLSDPRTTGAFLE